MEVDNRLSHTTTGVQFGGVLETQGAAHGTHPVDECLSTPVAESMTACGYGTRNVSAVEIFDAGSLAARTPLHNSLNFEDFGDRQFGRGTGTFGRRLHVNATKELTAQLTAHLFAVAIVGNKGALATGTHDTSGGENRFFGGPLFDQFVGARRGDTKSLREDDPLALRFGTTDRERTQ